ncbi:uncharacterized protein RCC_11098 [Ramularia collo-cygni]|uniref:Zn(2)-C6 fungal-type domain-containing protein n=1 Tax=Ramularia collo-cygni TaxID=112498 RepID=A0A2D3V515_9PEZI|nr:uncharacterized protein RCC_11098 [Ramularia collo-cygni]CZT25367.1 uncharacterized protein RCC_11098 [Ramularia collo-cygni]
MDGGNNSAKAARFSCMTCSKAKAKCVRNIGEQICERCARLKKECHLKEPVLRRRKVVKPTRAAQLEKIESKIEHLVNALSSAPLNRRGEHGQPSPSISQPSAHIPNERSPGGSPSEAYIGPCLDDINIRRTGPPQASHHSETPGVPREVPVAPGPKEDVPLIDITLDEAEGLIHRYRQLLSPGLPFVALPDDATAQSMQEQRPVLLRAVTTVALFHDLPRQQLLVKDLIRAIGERMLVKGEQSLDILQGIIVLIGWFHPHVFWNRQLGNLIHLGISLSMDLGIDRKTQQFEQDVNEKPLRISGLAENRALLGLYFYTSMLSSNFKKMDAMPFTVHMQRCMESLDGAHEAESDLLLVQMVRLQRVIETIHTTDRPIAPARLYVKAYQADVERLRRLDRCSENNTFIHLQYLIADMHIAELALADLAESRGVSLSGRLEDLHRCVEALKAFFEVFFTVPSSVYFLIPFATFSHFAHALIVWKRLAAIDTEQWSLRSMVDQLNFNSILDELATRFEEPQQAALDLNGGLPIHNDSFSYWSKRLRWLKQMYAARSDPATTRTGAETEQQFRAPSGSNQPTPPEDIFSADFFSMDDNFWSWAGDFDLGFPEAVS